MKWKSEIGMVSVGHHTESSTPVHSVIITQYGSTVYIGIAMVYPH